MQRIKSTPILNNNCPPYYFPNTNNNQKSKVKRIKPNKFTFLDSNLMVSNILNHQNNNSIGKKRKNNNCINNESNKLKKQYQKRYQSQAQQNSSILNTQNQQLQNLNNHKKIDKTYFQQQKQIKEQQQQSTDAYINCQKEIKKYQQYKELENIKINRVKQQANATLRAFSEDKKQLDKKIKENVQNIRNMKDDMIDRAAQIMSKRQDSQYTGRNISKTGIKMIKQCKQNSFPRVLIKLQNTRRVMKDKTKLIDKKRNKNLQSENFPQQNLSENSGSFGDSSCISNILQKQNLADSKQNKLLTDMLKNKSYDQVFQQQRRRGVCIGFMKNWKNYDINNGQILILKKKGTNKKSHPQSHQQKQKQSQQDDKQMYLGSNKSKRYFGLSQYKQTFDQLATTYTISSR